MLSHPEELLVCDGCHGISTHYYRHYQHSRSVVIVVVVEWRKITFCGYTF